MDHEEKPDMKKSEKEILDGFLKVFEKEYGYPKENIHVNFPLNLGRRTVIIDAAVLKKKLDQDPFILIEIKKEISSPISADQLKTYLSLSPARYALLTDGDRKLTFRKVRHDLIAKIPDLPHKSLPELTIYIKDNLTKPTNLELLFRRIIDRMRTDEGLDSRQAFDEFYKLIFAKLLDEEKPGRKCDFRVELDELIGVEERNKVGDEFMRRINNLLEQANQKYPDVISQKPKINLDPRTLAAVVSELQPYSIGKLSEDVIGGFYEKTMGAMFRRETWKYFTPRELVEFVIQMLDPTFDEVIVDPACGSGGFLVACVRAVQEKNDRFRTTQPDKQKEKMKEAYSQNNVFGIDINEHAATIARMNLLMHGGGNVYRTNSLLGPDKLAKIMQRETKYFDIVVCDPPKGLKVLDRKILSLYCLSHGKKSQSVEILFLELCVRLAKPGGRIGIILPNSVLTNAMLKYARDFLREQVRIKSIIALPSSLFTPYSSLRENLLLLEKKVQPSRKKEDYEILMAVVKKSGYLSHVLKKFKKFEHRPREVKYECTKAISIFTINSLKLDSRLDPEYYSPEYLDLEKKLDKYPILDLGRIATIIAGVYIPANRYGTEGIPYIRISDLAEGMIEPTKFVIVLPEDKGILEKGRLKGNEILVSKTGTIGKVALVPESLRGAVASSDLAIVRLNASAIISALYLYHMLSSDLVTMQIRRRASGSVIPRVNLRDLKQIRIPILPTHMQKHIEKKVRAFLNEHEEHFAEKRKFQNQSRRWRIQDE